MSKQLLLKTPRACLICSDPLAHELKVMKLKEKTVITVVYVLCANHEQVGNSEIQKAMADHPDRITKMTIGSLSRNAVTTTKDFVEIWG